MTGFLIKWLMSVETVLSTFFNNISNNALCMSKQFTFHSFKLFSWKCYPNYSLFFLSNYSVDWYSLYSLGYDILLCHFYKILSTENELPIILASLACLFKCVFFRNIVICSKCIASHVIHWMVYKIRKNVHTYAQMIESYGV